MASDLTEISAHLIQLPALRKLLEEDRAEFILIDAEGECVVERQGRRSRVPDALQAEGIRGLVQALRAADAPVTYRQWILRAIPGVYGATIVLERRAESRVPFLPVEVTHDVRQHLDPEKNGIILGPGRAPTTELLLWLASEWVRQVEASWPVVLVSDRVPTESAVDAFGPGQLLHAFRPSRRAEARALERLLCRAALVLWDGVAGVEDLRAAVGYAGLGGRWISVGAADMRSGLDRFDELQRRAAARVEMEALFVFSEADGGVELTHFAYRSPLRWIESWQKGPSCLPFLDGGATEKSVQRPSRAVASTAHGAMMHLGLEEPSDELTTTSPGVLPSYRREALLAEASELTKPTDAERQEAAERARTPQGTQVEAPQYGVIQGRSVAPASPTEHSDRTEPEHPLFERGSDPLAWSEGVAHRDVLPEISEASLEALEPAQSFAETEQGLGPEEKTLASDISDLEEQTSEPDEAKRSSHPTQMGSESPEDALEHSEPTQPLRGTPPYPAQAELSQPATGLKQAKDRGRPASRKSDYERPSPSSGSYQVHRKPAPAPVDSVQSASVPPVHKAQSTNPPALLEGGDLETVSAEGMSEIIRQSGMMDAVSSPSSSHARGGEGDPQSAAETNYDTSLDEERRRSRSTRVAPEQLGDPEVMTVDGMLEDGLESVSLSEVLPAIEGDSPTNPEEVSEVDRLSNDGSPTLSSASSEELALRLRELRKKRQTSPGGEPSVGLVQQADHGDDDVTRERSRAGIPIEVEDQTVEVNRAETLRQLQDQPNEEL